MRRTIFGSLLAFVLAAVVGVAAAGTTMAQHQHSPYAGHESSEIPSLTPEELQSLREGEGMGMAKVAELNRYPGPMHSLELAAELGLTPDQRERVQAIFDEMRGRARALGAEIIDAERHLNLRFASEHIDEAALREAVEGLAELRGRLRFTHLRAHLHTRAVLEPGQVEAYDRLRGYGQGAERGASEVPARPERPGR